MRLRRIAASTLVAALGASTITVASGVVSGAAGAASAPSCSPSALKGATGPITLNFWESMPRANGEELTRLTDQFNASQSKVHVNLVAQTSYQDTFTKYQAGLSNGELPDIAMLTDTDTQAAIDTQSFMPVQQCISAFKYPTGDFLARALAYWKVAGSQWAMPFGVSGPVLFYNKLAFSKAGLNPDQPPATLPQLVAAANTLKTKGQGGLGLVLDPWHLETWMATANQVFVNNKNGRASRATKTVFTNKTGLSIFANLSQLVKNGSATTNPIQGAGRYDNLLGVGSGKYSMTIDTSAALGTVQQLLATGQYPNVELGVAPFPKLSAASIGGVEPGGNGLWISKHSSAAKRAAAWTYIAYLDSTASQVAWSAGTGYVPLRKSSAASTTIQDLWTQNPAFKVAYTQLTKGVQSAATAGAVVGPFNDVHAAIADAEASMFVSGVGPAKALAQAAFKSNQIIASYNSRLGVG